MKKSLLVILLIFISFPVYSEINSKAIDRMVELTLPEDGPGGALLICKDDKVIYKKASGYSDIDAKIPNTPGTVFQIGSISKMMTAAGILLLADQKKLSLQDPVTGYIPDFIEPASKVTIENLLLHNSGIKSFTGIPEWNPSWDSKRSLEETVNLVKNKEFDFQPGERYLYNNSGYAMLAYIIEKVSGMSYGDFMKKKIFLPLGMKHTRHGADSDDIGVRSKGYSLNIQDQKNVKSVFTEFAQLSGAGSIISTVDDLLIFDKAMKDKKLLSKESWEKAVSKLVFTGPDTYYGYGWVIQDIKGREAVWHNGGMPGFLSANYNFVNDGITVIFLSNSDFINADTMVMQVAAYLFNFDSDRRKPVIVSSDKLKRYEGIYPMMGLKNEIKLYGDNLTWKSAGYMKEPQKLTPTSENTFFIDGRYDVYFSFPADDDKPVVLMEMELTGQTFKIYKEGYEPETIKLSTDQLKKYEGLFEFVPGVDVKIYIEKDELKAFLKSQPVYTLEPIGDHKFILKGMAGFSFIFDADSSGKIMELTSSQPNGDFKAKRKE